LKKVFSAYQPPLPEIPSALVLYIHFAGKENKRTEKSRNEKKVNISASCFVLKNM